MADALNNSIASPSGDVRFKATFTRTSDDIDPNTGVSTDYQNCEILAEFTRSASSEPVASLSIGSGLSRVTNNAGLQIVTGAVEQSILYANRNRQLFYRFTITTASGAKISGGSNKPGYFGKFNIRSF